MARRDPVGIRLITRGGHDWSGRYPLVVEAVNHLKLRSCLIDGEVVCCEERGVAAFQMLRHRRNEPQAFLYAFDLLALNGTDLRKEPARITTHPTTSLHRRVACLARILPTRREAMQVGAVLIPMVLATLGGELEIPTIGRGKTFVKVPEGTQSGSRFRLRGKGMPALNSRQIGDMFVQVVVETPQKLSERQRELLHEFQKASSRDTNPESAGFFDKVREFFGDWQVRAERHKYGAEAI
jgi:hypothetical protein